MIEVYQKENTNYDYNGDITLQPISCIFEMKINGICQIELTHYIDDLERWKYLAVDNVIACPTMYSKKQLFRIYEITKSNKKIKVYARHIFLDARHTIIFDKVASVKTCQEALNIYLADTGFSGASNITSLRSSTANRVSIMEILCNTELETSIINTWGGERLYDNFTVHVNNRIGGDYGVKVNFSHNLKEIEAEENIDDVITRIVPVSKDDIGIDEKYIDSNYIANYSRPKAKVIQYNDCYINEQIVEAINEIQSIQYEINIRNSAILDNNKKLHEYNKVLSELNIKKENLEKQKKKDYTSYTNAVEDKEHYMIGISTSDAEQRKIEDHLNVLTTAIKELEAANEELREYIVKANLRIEELGYDDLEGYANEAEVKKALKTKCYEEYTKGIDQPHVNYKIDMVNITDTELYKEFAQLENVSIGDTVYCRCKKIDIDVVARCNYIKWNCITRKTESLEIGNISNDFVDNLTSVSNAISKITGENGTVKADAIKGVINAVNTSFKAQRSVSQKQQVRAMLFEDLDITSYTYGAMSIGTMGFCIANKRTLDGKDWDWSTFGTGKGFFADYIVAGTMLADRIKGGTLEVGGSGLAVDGSITVSNANGAVIGIINKNGITMNSGAININNNFIVDSSGNLIARSGTFSGTIKSSSVEGGTITGTAIKTGNIESGIYDLEATNGGVKIRNRFYLEDYDGTKYLSFDGSGKGKLTITEIVLKLGKIRLDPGNDSKGGVAVFDTPQQIFVMGKGASGGTWDSGLKKQRILSDGTKVNAWDIGDAINFLAKQQIEEFNLRGKIDERLVEHGLI